MPQNDKIQLFEDKRIRTAWDEETEEWYFSIVDVCEVLSAQIILAAIGATSRENSNLRARLNCTKKSYS